MPLHVIEPPASGHGSPVMGHGASLPARRAPRHGTPGPVPHPRMCGILTPGILDAPSRAACSITCCMLHLVLHARHRRGAVRGSLEPRYRRAMSACLSFHGRQALSLCMPPGPVSLRAARPCLSACCQALSLRIPFVSFGRLDFRCRAATATEGRRGARGKGKGAGAGAGGPWETRAYRVGFAAAAPTAEEAAAAILRAVQVGAPAAPAGPASRDRCRLLPCGHTPASWGTFLVRPVAGQPAATGAAGHPATGCRACIGSLCAVQAAPRAHAAASRGRLHRRRAGRNRACTAASTAATVDTGDARVRGPGPAARRGQRRRDREVDCAHFGATGAAMSGPCQGLHALPPCGWLDVGQHQDSPIPRPACRVPCPRPLPALHPSLRSIRVCAPSEPALHPSLRSIRVCAPSESMLHPSLCSIRVYAPSESAGIVGASAGARR
jgi:hypothetical protein